MKKKAKKAVCVVALVVLFIALICGAVFLYLFLTDRPTTTVDVSAKTGAVTNGASGFLYGLAEPDVPTAEIAESIEISTLSTKAFGGLQHPIGDINQVADTFLAAGGKELIVYTQDMYDTWYYQFDSMPAYLERVRATVTATESADYAEHVTYCIFNEMDNGAWFGDFSEYDNRVKTYEAWKETYNLVRSINPNAKIGGPGYCNYKSEYIQEFLEYCKSENCLPNTMIWHELGKSSLYMWEEHFADYDRLCKELLIEKMPVCITEYGLMKTNGIPGESVKWISRIEAEKTEGCVAYWRLANNLSDVAADDVTPNSNWWAYRWYAELIGETLKTESKDFFQSNLGKFLLRQSDELKYAGFTALATLDEENKKIQMIAGGSDRDSTIVLNNLHDSEAFADTEVVCVTVEHVDFKGLGGAVLAPKADFTRLFPVDDSSVTIDLDDTLYTQCYRITVTPTSVTRADYDTGEVSVVGPEPDEYAMLRYEAEDAKLFGTAKATDKTAYAASQEKVVRLNSTQESGVQFTVEAVEDGVYYLDLIYGNGANGIQYDDNGNAIDKGVRSPVKIRCLLDSEEIEIGALQSTIKDDFTDCVSLSVNLTAGKHTVRFILPQNTNLQETLAFDFLDVSKERRASASIYLALDAANTTEDETGLLALVSKDGFYEVFFPSAQAPTALKLNGIPVENAVFNPIETGNSCTLYLRRGISQLSINKPLAKHESCKIRASVAGETYTTAFAADKLTCTGAATLQAPTDSVAYIDNISCDAESAAQFTYTAAKAGYYQFTFLYSNNEEGGAHDYNVDLVERYITLSLNGEKVDNFFFRNTYSWDTYKTKTVSLYLQQGENNITLHNDGSYRFNQKTTYAPQIAEVTVSPLIITD